MFSGEWQIGKAWMEWIWLYHPGSRAISCRPLTNTAVQGKKKKKVREWRDEAEKRIKSSHAIWSSNTSPLCPLGCSPPPLSPALQPQHRWLFSSLAWVWWSVGGLGQAFVVSCLPGTRNMYCWSIADHFRKLQVQYRDCFLHSNIIWGSKRNVVFSF